MAKHPDVGDPAPDFELEGTEGSFRLSDHRGERVVLLFYPGDNTAVCTKQFCSYRDNADAFGALDATVVGISSQSVDSHQGWTEKHGLNVPLLADEGGAVAKQYGAHAPIVGTKRAVIVDRRGRDRPLPARPPARDSTSSPWTICARRSPRCPPVREASLPETLTIPARFNGPPGSANGGYTCGRVAQLVGAEEVEVSLRKPPPLERPLEVVRDGERVELRDGDTLVAEGQPAELLIRRARRGAARRGGRGGGGGARASGPRSIPSPPAWSAARPARPATGCASSPLSCPAATGLFGACWTPGELGERRRRLGAARAACGRHSTAPRARRSRTSARARRWCSPASPPGSAARCAWASRTRSCRGASRSTGRKRRAAAALYDSDGASHLRVARALDRAAPSE